MVHLTDTHAVFSTAGTRYRTPAKRKYLITEKRFSRMSPEIRPSIGGSAGRIQGCTHGSGDATLHDRREEY